MNLHQPKYSLNIWDYNYFFLMSRVNGWRWCYSKRSKGYLARDRSKGIYIWSCHSPPLTHRGTLCKISDQLPKFQNVLMFSSTGKRSNEGNKIGILLQTLRGLKTLKCLHHSEQSLCQYITARSLIKLYTTMYLFFFSVHPSVPKAQQLCKSIFLLLSGVAPGHSNKSQLSRLLIPYSAIGLTWQKLCDIT